jgi:glutathione S-transferase
LRLLQAPRSPFCVKVRLVIFHLDLGGRVSLIDTDPWTEEAVRYTNPLCKVPTLLLEDGTSVYDSRVICEFLNSYAGGGLVPAGGAARWAVLTGEAIADGLAEAVIRRHVEGLYAPTEQSQAVRWRQELAIRAALAAIEARIVVSEVTLADLAAFAAIHYLDHRSPDLGWREAHPNLGTWFDEHLHNPRTAYALAPARRS